MVHDSHVFNVQLELARVQLNLRVGHADRLQCVGLGSERLFIRLEVVHTVGEVGTLDLLPAIVVNLRASFEHVLFAEADQAQMLVEVLLLSHDARLFDLERLRVLQFDLCALLKNHMDDTVEILVDLRHDFDLALFDLLPQLGALVDQKLGAPAQGL